MIGPVLFPEPGPRLFALAPGADLPASLAAGLRQRLSGQPPEAMAGVTVFLNTQRLRRRLRDCLTETGATILPRLRLVTELGSDPLLSGTALPVSPLGRRLELAVLVERLLRAEPGLAPRSALFDLADSLAGLMDEMRAEAVPPERVIGLDVAQHAAHWARVQGFVGLVARFFGPSAAPDAEALLRAATEALIARWQAAPPQGPVIVAGSTGSRGTTALLMRAVAHLPQGALLLPGFDLDQPETVWAGMEDALTHEDHPQYRYRRLLDTLGLDRSAVRDWGAPPPDPARNRLISLALRPAPVTDQWIAEGPSLPDLAQATGRITLIEAPGPRQEALAIALRLRQALEQGQSAALLTPDRELTRRVTAALDRWGILPDDSAGIPLQHAPPGRLLCLIGRGLGRRLAVDELLALLKHPLAFSGGDRGQHLLLSRELELHLRRKGPAFPDAGFLTAWAAARDAAPWGLSLAGLLDGIAAAAPAPLADLAAHHRALAEALAGGETGGSGGLWEKQAGAEALAAMEDLARESPEGFALSPADYAALAEAVIARRAVRDSLGRDPRLQILGPQEARIQGADLVILAGLNEGIWPARPAPDPWLNRKMRAESGLLLPERRIGLSAHDFQIAAAAPEVVLSRASRDAEAETVASRWLNRLTNLLSGLAATGGPQALAAMKARGDALLALAAQVETPAPLPAAPRPAPRPPLALRPQRLALTAIERLIRDPYAIYAAHVLRLRPLPPLRALADARLRGEVLHRVPETLLRQGLPPDPAQAAEALLRITAEVLAQDVPWPGMRAVWQARMAQIALPFAEMLLAEGGSPAVLERQFEVTLPDLGFTLVGKPDRIDLLADGAIRIVDYKTGTPPSKDQQKHFAKQLDLAALMAALGAFPGIEGISRVQTQYVGLKPGLKVEARLLGPEDIDLIRQELTALILAWRDPARGYVSRRAVFGQRDGGDYDDLARFGEWDMTATPAPEDVG
ncbi:double-strand break repair protein AddB [Xinfangfangia pollutisoli]|uniref:double-strand break repair protein AddB n=1 Tax=Xinfangfangia pollutisoli TaxID=2865960 RepID=UPI001CD2CFB1|nr:double-strand break repair protein AddB [Xinfangfangia pollutisoli]